MDYEFEKEVYRYKCKVCRQLFCMPNCGLCPVCEKRPGQENSLCFDCLSNAFDNPEREESEDALIRPGYFVAVGHDQVMHLCVNREYHIWQREPNGQEN